MDLCGDLQGALPRKGWLTLVYHTVFVFDWTQFKEYVCLFTDLLCFFADLNLQCILFIYFF